jgi:hypothetical protein
MYRQPRSPWCRRFRCGARCNATLSFVSTAGFEAECCAVICGSNTGSRLRTIAPDGSCRPITRSPLRAIRSIAQPWQSSWASAARRTKPVSVGGASSGETPRAQTEPARDDLAGGGGSTSAEAAGTQAARTGCRVAKANVPAPQEIAWKTQLLGRRLICDNAVYLI